jgi:hypothetical protein
VRRATFVLPLTIFLVGGSAHAYRPFDGTDAAVEDVGALTLEAGALQFHWSGDESAYAPRLGVNFGLAERLEAVVDVQQWVALESTAGESRVRSLDSGALLKWLLREGALQEQARVSVAIEAGLQPPEMHGDEGFGASLTAAVGYRWNAVKLHVNQRAGRSRGGNLVLANSLMLDGPEAWAVRPLAELFAEQELDDGASYGLLLGAIATASDSLAFDLGMRVARDREETAFELRLGLSWSVRLVAHERGSSVRSWSFSTSPKARKHELRE